MALLALLALLVGGELRAQEVWEAAAPAGLDPRLEAQLGAIASKHKVELSSPASERTARPGQPVLRIEFKTAKTPQELIRKIRNVERRVPPDLTPEVVGEAYLLEATYERSSRPSRVTLRAATPEGFHLALLRLDPLLEAWPSKAGSLLPAVKFQAARSSRKRTEFTVVDYPSFAERGIVEGFYGAPWSHQDRLDILRFEGAHRMNVYYYAPKDDPYHRKLWREPYPPEPTKQLGELVDTAKQNFVRFCFAVSPGLSMVYSSDDDFSKLTAKLVSVEQLGVSCFALFLDDVPEKLQNPPDQARFKDLGAAHVYLINKLDEYLSRFPGSRLVVTPTTYTNAWGSRDYIKELGAGVNPDVDLVWTGRHVVSPIITAADAREWGKLLRRPPLVWDNFPVNDGIPWRMNLGPVIGRGPDLGSAVRGLVSNPMIQAHASMIPLATVAGYLWNSRPYDPSQAHRQAVVNQYGKDAPPLLKPFFDVYGDYWWQQNLFQPLWVEQRTPVDVSAMDRALGRMDSAVKAITPLPQFAHILPEISPFPMKTRERLEQMKADGQFRALAHGKLQWRDDYDVLQAARVASPPVLDGDFAKWAGGRVYDLKTVVTGADFVNGPEQFAARAALAWDESCLYVGIEVTDPDLYQPYAGEDVTKGDVVGITLETAFRKNFLSTRAGPDEYPLYFSPGDFAGVPASVYLDRRHPNRDYAREIKTAWKKTPTGFSGDIAIPVSYFAGKRFQTGYEVGIALGAQKVLPAATPPDDQDVARIALSAKSDSLFPSRSSNPATYQRLVLVAAPAGSKDATTPSN